MSPSDTTPVSLAMSQVELRAALLARAFQHDPMMKYLMSDSAKMHNKPARFYQAAIRMGLLYGEVYTIPSMEGVAVWVSPGNADFTFGQLLRSGFLFVGVEPSQQGKGIGGRAAVMGHAQRTTTTIAWRKSDESRTTCRIVAYS